LQALNESFPGDRTFSDELLIRAAQRGLLGHKMTLNPESTRHIFEATRESNTRLLQRYCPSLSPSDELKLPAPSVEQPIDPRIVQELADLAQTLLVDRGVDAALARRAFQSLKEGARD
jgi:hypothetical protein